MHDFFHILNPSRRHRSNVRRFFKTHADLAHIWVERKSHPAHLETIVEWAFNEGRNQIAVWGGDGTLSRVVQRLYELNAFDKMTVALIPVGTCNDFARKLELPPWKAYVHLALQSPALDRNFDIGLISSGNIKRAFINNAGFGRTASAVRGARRSNPVKDIFEFTPKRLDLEWSLDGAKHFETRRSILAVACNAPFFNKAMHFDKNVAPDDGTLNIFLEDPQSKMKLLSKFFLSRLGLPLANGSTFRIDAQNLRVESDTDLYLQVDGEPAGTQPARRLEYAVAPQKLRFAMWTV